MKDIKLSKEEANLIEEGLDSLLNNDKLTICELITRKDIIFKLMQKELI